MAEMKSEGEYEKFEHLANNLLKVSHGSVKRKIDAERKSKKRKKSRKSSASRVGA